MKVRKASYLDAPVVLSFLQANKDQSGFDFRVLDYPTVGICVAEQDGLIKSVLPVHTVYVLESLGHNPSATAGERAAAVYAMLHMVETQARDAGIAELHFISSDERIDESAIERCGFEKVTVLRKRL